LVRWPGTALVILVGLRKRCAKAVPGHRTPKCSTS